MIGHKHKTAPVETDEIELIRRFHGHLGPNVIFGYRMGRLVRSERPKDVIANVYCGSEPPLSCLIDGIQLTSGCTMGKNNIRVVGEGKLKAVFIYKDGRTLAVTVRSDVEERLNTGITHDNEDERSVEAFGMTDDELFEIVEGRAGF